MSKQEYDAFAALIKAQLKVAKTPEAIDALENLARDMADYLGSRSPRFDGPLFLAAVGLK